MGGRAPVALAVVASIPLFAVGGVPSDSAVAHATWVAVVAVAYAFAAVEWYASSPARD